MPTKYAIRITEANIDFIDALSPIVDVNVKEDTNRFFLFTVTANKKIAEHDVVSEVDLEIYDGNEAGTRIILQ